MRQYNQDLLDTILASLNEIPKPIQAVADHNKIKYDTAKRYLFALLVDGKAKVAKISGIKMFTKSINEPSPGLVKLVLDAGSQVENTSTSTNSDNLSCAEGKT